MKRFRVIALLLVAFLLAAGPLLAAEKGMKTETGKVTAVDPEGKAIVITVGKGKTALDVGTIVEPNTKLTVKGKNVPVTELTKEVKPGDTVTLKYVFTDNLYAKQIIKK